VTLTRLRGLHIFQPKLSCPYPFQPKLGHLSQQKESTLAKTKVYLSQAICEKKNTTNMTKTLSNTWHPNYDLIGPNVTSHPVKI
jgi:hypothetical protein